MMEDDEGGAGYKKSSLKLPIVSDLGGRKCLTCYQNEHDCYEYLAEIFFFD